MTLLNRTHVKILCAASATVIALANASGASAQETTSQTVQPQAAGSTIVPSDIVVIGTRRLDRSALNSASPVDIIGSEEIKSQPSANMLDTVKNIVPSFFVAQNTISDASSFVRSPSLRGLPGDEVLVMLDGKRYNRSALVQVYSGGDTGLSYGAQGSDISALPALAIKSLQVLRDGATAQYGSDAIAGVLNYGLRDANHGIELVGRYGQYYRNGDGNSYQIAGNVGLALGDRGFVNITGEYDDDGQTSRGVTRPTALLFAQQNPSLASQIPNYPLPAQIWGSSPSHGYKAVLNAGYDVTDSSKLYLFVNIARTKTNESFNYRPSVTQTGVIDSAGVSHTLSRNGSFKPIYLTPCPTGNPTCPSGGFVQDNNTFSFASIYPAGFTPRFVGVTQEVYGTAGYKGKTAGGFTYDLSGSLSQNTLDLSMYNSLSPSYGPQSQTSFKFGKTYQREVDVNGDFSYPIELGFASPLTVSFGGEYRRETYKLTAGDTQSYGAGPFASQTLYTQVSPGVYSQSGTASQSPAASGYGGTSPQAAGSWSQDSYGFYGDLETDVIKALSVGLAGRYEHYSNFGSATVGKFSAIYHILKGLAIRGGVGTGFHAPSPGQSHDSILTTNFIAGNQVQTGTFPVDSPIAQYYGAKPLKPEKATNWTLGFVANPGHAFTLTVDYYNIKVTNRIFVSQPFSVKPADILAQPGLASVGAGGNVSYFTNGLDTLTRGIDVVGTYRTDLGGGKLNLTLAYNYNKSTVSRADNNVISTAQIIDIKHLAPNHRATFTANWQSGPWTINGRENFYGKWQDAVDYPTAQDAAGNVTAAQVFGSKFTTDLDVSYTFRTHYTLTVGATNLFNTFPDKIAASSFNAIYPITGGLGDGQVYPRSGGPFGINGGFWYARVRVAF
ncbi:TonB-dependent receptor plug domain-containing protein [Sphingomonas sp. GlSt437]|uniref:TonB-dependent receptor plug domain-containing protein n=1 Tax=Sphingomonas sp. GlSt437 TaxID=3389970 RepID=UPI003A843BBF